MKHQLSLEGWTYRLRPVTKDDAQFIIDVRREDADRNRFVHRISPEIQEQLKWLEAYFERDGDYYFVVENRVTGRKEGLIAFYNVVDKKAEWGRWVLRKGSFAAAESVYLLYRIAFEKVALEELYCRTILDNTAVVSFHTSIGEKTRKIDEKSIELDGNLYDAVEQYANREIFYSDIAPKLESNAELIMKRMLKKEIGGFRFSHLGIACKSIDAEIPIYRLIGYKVSSEKFVDNEQGIRGVFMDAEGKPQIELLENLQGSHTLDQQLKNGIKIYHAAFLVDNIQKAIALLQRNRGRIIKPIKDSTFYKKKICFMLFPNILMIELIENNM